MLEGVTVPSLVVVGREDAYTPVRSAELMAQRIPAATLAVAGVWEPCRTQPFTSPAGQTCDFTLHAEPVVDSEMIATWRRFPTARAESRGPCRCHPAERAREWSSVPTCPRSWVWPRRSHT